MEDWENRARKIAEKAAARDGVFPFLRVCVENRNLSLINLLLVFEQNPEAKMVCGKRAWEQLGRTIKADASPIQIILPEILPEQEEKYHVVSVYDYDSTEGKEKKEKQEKIAFADRITQLTGATWELVPEEAMKERLERGFYKEENHVFYLSDACTREQQEQTILELYIDYVLTVMGNNDKLVRLAVCFVVYEYFGVKHTIVSALFGKLGKMNPEEKWKFLSMVWHISKRVLDDLEGYRLTFNETAFLNDLLVTDNPEEMEQIFDQASKSISNEEWKEELLSLKEKLLISEEGFLTELCRRKYQKQLFSYPPVAVEVENTDSLREERRAYDAG